MTALSLSKPVLYARSSLFMLCFSLLTVVYAVPMVCSWVLPMLWRYRVLRPYPKITLWLLRMICGLKHTIEGLDNLPERPAIIFSKHQSTWETLALTAYLPAAAYVAKRELLWVPFFGWGMASLRFITIDRSAGRKAVEQIVDQAKDRLSKGLWIIIFPEGTRKAAGAAPQYKMGGAVMAAETAAPIVPVALNAGEFWPRHSLIKWPGTITMSIGPAIQTENKSAEQIRDESQTWIESKMTEISVSQRFPY